MTTPEVFRMLEDAKSFGIGAYNAWTAEPLLRRDLPDILRYAKGQGLITSLVTNGVLLKSRVHELGDLDYLSVSLDGLKSQKGLRGIDPDAVIDGIIAARDAGHEILINCVISSKSLHELDDMVSLARSLGVWISFEPIDESSGVDEKVWDELGIRNEIKFEYEQALDRLMDLKKNGAPIINSQTYLRMIKSQKADFRCHASDIVLHVCADGNIVNCRVEKAPLGNVSDGIQNVWDSSREMRKQASKNCRGCLFFGYVENSMLYDFVPEVMAHYEWM